jgi:hypothetical protein
MIRLIWRLIQALIIWPFALLNQFLGYLFGAILVLILIALFL